jgi:hypothetical protein
MATLTAAVVAETGTVESLASAAGGGDEFINTGGQFFIVVNGSGGSINVTFDSPNADNFGFTGSTNDLVVAVANGARTAIGPFRTDRFNDANGKVQVSYSGVSSVTVGVWNFNHTN